MNEYVEILKRHMAEKPPNYGSDTHSILETYYHECNDTDTDDVKAGFVEEIKIGIRLQTELTG